MQNTDSYFILVFQDSRYVRLSQITVVLKFIYWTKWGTGRKVAAMRIYIYYAGATSVVCKNETVLTRNWCSWGHKKACFPGMWKRSLERPANRSCFGQYSVGDLIKSHCLSWGSWVTCGGSTTRTYLETLIEQLAIVLGVDSGFMQDTLMVHPAHII